MVVHNRRQFRVLVFENPELVDFILCLMDVNLLVPWSRLRPESGNAI